MADTPKIRFKGFTDEWERRKVKDIAPLQRGFDLPTSQMEEGVYPVVMSNGIGGYHSQYKVKGPGIVTGRSGTIGKLHYIEDDYWPHNTTLWVTDFYGNNQKFIYYMYQCLDLLGFSTGSGVPTLNRNDVHDEVVCIPSADEQKKIGKYFTALDHLITLHQRKCDETKELKKYMLQKMFPRNGRKNPEIRFAGFTDDWEQRKLGDVATSFEYGLNAAAKEYDGENKYIRITDIDDNTREFLMEGVTSPDTDLTIAGNYKLVKGDILFARTGASVGKSYIYRNSDGLVYYAGFLIRARIKEEYDAEFIFQNTLTDKYYKYITVTSQRSGQPGVNAQEYAAFGIQVPSKAEQQQIGEYFRHLDHLITLHQRKCNELKEVKKFMLQNMFI